MSISLKQSMKLGKFSECEVVAGHKGIDKVIKNITIMEVPDIVQWLKGRELILTSLFAIKDDLDAQNILIQQLHYAGATALAIKPFHSLDDIPQGIISSANKLDFPIIKIPKHVKYLDILSPVMHHIFNEKVVLQEDLEQATNMLQEISRNSEGLQSFAENVSYMTKNSVTIESPKEFIETEKIKGRIPLTSVETSELAMIKRPILLQRNYKDKLVPCIVAPIFVNDEVYGNITCWQVKSEHIALDIAILEKASTLLSLEFLKVKVKDDIEQQYKNDFLRELLFSEHINVDNIIDWGEKYDVREEDEYYCLIIKLRKDNLPTINNGMKMLDIASIVERRWPNVLLGQINGLLVVILNKEIAFKDYQKLYEEINSNFKESSYIDMAIGEKGQGPIGIRRSYNQSKQALKLVRKVNSNRGIVFYEELGIYRLLSLLEGREELIDYYNQTIGKLKKQDKKKELITTLKVYFQSDEVLNITAKTLFIHVNTLKYRLNKIKEITGLNIKKSEDKTSLFIGLKIYELYVK